MPDDSNRIGLCINCRHVRTVKHPRGGEDYYRCGKHDEDPTYPKYPPLPVRECDAFSPSERNES